jgi:hypothetical protein
VYSRTLRPSHPSLFSFCHALQVPLQHWTTAVLFSRLSADVIIRCLNVLLLETTLVIVGEDLGLVSAIGTALISLLEPFQWDGVFIPLLPSSLSDFLQSPVPLVVGVVPPFDASRHMGAAVLTIGGHGEHLRTPQLQVKLPLCYQLLQVRRHARGLAYNHTIAQMRLKRCCYLYHLDPSRPT